MKKCHISDETPVYYASIEDMCDIIRKAHNATGRDRREKSLGTKYANIRLQQKRERGPESHYSLMLTTVVVKHFKEGEIGDNVPVFMPTVDRRREEPHNFLGVINDYRDNDLNTIAVPSGVCKCSHN